MSAHDRLFWAVILVGGLGALPWRRALEVAAVCVPILVVSKYHGLGESGMLPLLELLGFALGGKLLLAAGDGAIRYRGGPSGAIQIGVVLGVLAAAIGASGSMFYAQWAGTLGLGFGLITLAAWRDWNAGQLDGASTMLLAGAFALMAVEYSELDPWNAVLILGALPLSLVATHFLAETKPRALIGWLVMLAPIIVAIVRVALAQEADPYADYR